MASQCVCVCMVAGAGVTCEVWLDCQRIVCHFLIIALIFSTFSYLNFYGKFRLTFIVWHVCRFILFLLFLFFGLTNHWEELEKFWFIRLNHYSAHATKRALQEITLFLHKQQARNRKMKATLALCDLYRYAYHLCVLAYFSTSTAPYSMHKMNATQAARFWVDHVRFSTLLRTFLVWMHAIDYVSIKCWQNVQLSWLNVATLEHDVTSA